MTRGGRVGVRPTGGLEGAHPLLDELEVLLLALLAIPAGSLLLWILLLRLTGRHHLGFGEQLLLGAVASVVVAGALWTFGGDAAIPELGVGVGLGFILAEFGLGYVDEWGEPMEPYGLGCAPLAVVAAIVFGVFLVSVDMPPLGDALLVGGMLGPGVALIATLAWLRWGPEGDLGCLPIIGIAAVAAVFVAGAGLLYHDEWSPIELVVATGVGGILAFGVGGLLDRYQPNGEPFALGCLPPAGLFGLVLILLAIVFLAPPTSTIGDEPGPGATPAATAMPTATAISEVVTPEPATSPLVTPEPATSEPVTPAPPTATPTASPTPMPTPAPTETPATFAATDQTGDTTLDDGQPVEDPAVDIAGVTWQKLLDRVVLSVITLEGLGESFSAAWLAFIGSSGNEASGGSQLAMLGGGTVAQQSEQYYVFLWQVHDGVFTIGRVNPETFELVAGEDEGILIMREDNVVTFEIPLNQLPPKVDSIGIQTFRRETPADTLRSTDRTELIQLPPEMQIP